MLLPMEQGNEDIWSLTQGDWNVHKALMYLQLESAIEENRALILKLEKPKRQLVMRQMAWLNRNLLELDVWVEYAISSDDRAREFWEDSIRDAFSLLTQGRSRKGKKPKQPKSFEVPSPSGEDHDPEFQNLMRKAVGIPNPDHEPDAWTAVSEAATALRRDEEYRSQNQMLSKFVHPTAMSILLPLPLKSQKNLQEQFAEEGKRLSAAALKKLSASQLAEMYRRYKAIIDKVEGTPQRASLALGI